MMTKAIVRTGTVAALVFLAALYAQPPSKEYIYFNGRLIAIESTAAAITFAPAVLSVPAGAGTYSVTITIAAGAAWTAQTTAPWLTITSAAVGTGPGAITISVQPNGVNAPRSGALVVNGQSLTVNQAAGAVTLSPPNVEFGRAADSTAISVTAPAGLAWTATTTDPWIQLTNPNGTGNGAFSFSVTAAAGNRSGLITVGGQTLAVSQMDSNVRVVQMTISPNASSTPATFSFRVAGGSSVNLFAFYLNFTDWGGEACFLSLSPITRWVGLGDSVGQGWSQGSTAGVPYWLENMALNQSCRVNIGTAQINRAGPYWDFSIEIELRPWVRGDQVIRAITIDQLGAAPAGWVSLSPNYAPHAPPASPTFTITPTGATGMMPTFEYQAIIPNVASGPVDGKFIRVGRIFLGANETDTNGCTLEFATYGRTLQVDPPNGPIGNIGGSGTLTGPKCSVDLAGATLEPGAGFLKAKLPVTVAPALGAPKTVYGATHDRAGRWTGYTSTGTWTSTANPPAITSYTYSAITGESRGTYTYQFSNGGNYGGALILYRALPYPDGNDACYFNIDRQTNTVYLMHPFDGTAQAAVLGSSTVIENALCRIRAAGSSIGAAPGNPAAMLASIDLEFLPPMRGAQNGYALARDLAGSYSPAGWVPILPVRTPYPAPPLMSLSVSPSTSNAVTQTFTYRMQAGADGNFVRTGLFLINYGIVAANGCYVSFHVLSRRFYMDPHLPGPSGVAGTNATLNGTVCSLSLLNSAITADATGVTVTAAITFSSSFGGNMNNYLIADDRAGRATPWTQVGTWSGNATFSVSPAETFNVAVNQGKTLEAKCSGQPISATWSILYGQGSATLSNTTGPSTVVTASGIPAGAYIAVQAQADCPTGGALEQSVAYLYFNYFSQLPGPYVSPYAGTGAAQNFLFWWSIHVPSGGVVDGTAIEMLFAPNLSTADNTCYMLYYQNTVYLRSDTTATWQPIVNSGGGLPPIPNVSNPSSPYYTENSRCRFSWAGAFTSQDGFNRQVNMPMTFKPGFSGMKGVYTRQNNTDNTNTTGFAQRGTWNVP